MKRRIILSIIILVVIPGIGLGLYNVMAGSNSAGYEFATITRGDLESTITSSGTVSPVTTVVVGTQVSGTIARVYVDYNDRVRKGQLLAVLDTLLLKSAVLDAQAGVEKAEAQLEEATATYERSLRLFEEEVISEAEILPVRTGVKTQKATLKSATASLQRAEQNLKYALIRSPIDGTVIERNVEAGQTVAASLSTPTLFEIAEDLSQMEILVGVDESDIGRVSAGQSVRFDVQAYPDRIFEGTVRQIRLQPTTISNVVNYTVVVDAANDEHLLLPGMTATVDFIIDWRKNVLMASGAALRFQPTDEMLATLQEQRRGESARTAGGAQVPTALSRAGGSDSMAALWYLDERGNLAVTHVTTGLTEGSYTEITDTQDLTAGMQVITGTGHTENETTSKNTTNKSTNRGFGGGAGGPRPF